MIARPRTFAYAASAGGEESSKKSRRHRQVLFIRCGLTKIRPVVMGAQWHYFCGILPEEVLDNWLIVIFEEAAPGAGQRGTYRNKGDGVGKSPTSYAGGEFGSSSL